MSNKSIIDEAIEQMQLKIQDSLGKRTGDYRLGLYVAINILENLREVHKEEIEKAFIESRLTHPMIGFKHETFYNYYNETFNKEQDAKG